MRLQFILLIASATLMFGCDSSNSDSNSPDPAISVSGSYNLVTLNGNSLPAQVGTGVGAMTVLSGSLDLLTNGTYRLVYSFSIFGNNETFDESGSWLYRNDRLTMTHPERGVQFPDNSVSEGKSVTLNSTFGGPDSVPFILHFEK